MKKLISIYLLAIPIACYPLDHITQLDGSYYQYTNCLPALVKMATYVPYSVSELRYFMWYDYQGCVLSDAYRWIYWTTDIGVELMYEPFNDVWLDRYYVIGMIKRDGYNHFVLVESVEDSLYTIHDPMDISEHKSLLPDFIEQEFLLIEKQ